MFDSKACALPFWTIAASAGLHTLRLDRDPHPQACAIIICMKLYTRTRQFKIRSLYTRYDESRKGLLSFKPPDLRSWQNDLLWDTTSSSTIKVIEPSRTMQAALASAQTSVNFQPDEATLSKLGRYQCPTRCRSMLASAGPGNNIFEARRPVRIAPLPPQPPTYLFTAGRTVYHYSPLFSNLYLLYTYSHGWQTGMHATCHVCDVSVLTASSSGSSSRWVMQGDIVGWCLIRVQWAGEVISVRDKTIVTDEFRELEHDIELRRRGLYK